jgi:Fur family ferric uptake transcriptional regulator
MTDSENILSGLKDAGHRLTRIRKNLVHFLCSTSSPLSALEIIQKLEEENIQANKTTVYRELSFLLENGVASEVDLLDGKKRYELLSEDACHHHLVCTECEKIECLEVKHDFQALERQVKKEHNFAIESHVLEFFGRCKDCS